MVDNVKQVCAWEVDENGLDFIRTETIVVDESSSDLLKWYKVPWRYRNIDAIPSPLRVITNYVTTETKEKIIKVDEVKIKLIHDFEENYFFVEKEIEQLIKFCETTNNLPYFFSTATKLCSQWEDRYSVVTENELKMKMTEDGSIMIPILSQNKTILVELKWGISFVNGKMKQDINDNSEIRLDIVEDIFIEFSDSGRKLAESCNMPDNLIKYGNNRDNWSAKDHIKELKKMSSLHDTSTSDSSFISTEV